MGISVATRVMQLAARFPTDPAKYAHQFLNSPLTPQQVEICRLLLTPPYRVLVRSANNVGKTRVAACLASWFFDSFAPSITLATAPTRQQVRDLLFKELRSIRPLPYGFLPKDTRLQMGHDHFIHGLTAATPDAFHGRHAEKLLFLFDEASGIDRQFWQRTETMFGGHEGHGWLCLYNPNDSTSPAFAAEETGLWHQVVLSALDHPNIAAELAGLPPPIPSAIRLPRILDRIASECDRCEPSTEGAFEFPRASGVWYKPKTGEFEAQVLGLWPSVASTGVWSPPMLDRCLVAPSQPTDPDWPVQIGLDVARFGDDSTAIVARQGLHAVHAELLSSARSQQIVDRVASIASHLKPGRPRDCRIAIDSTGGYGIGVEDLMADWQVFPVNASSAALDESRYRNRRSELWFGTRESAEAGAVNLSALRPEHVEALRGELLAARYEFDERGRRRVRAKSQMKKLLGRSPDLADALNLAWTPLEADR